MILLTINVFLADSTNALSILKAATRTKSILHRRRVGRQVFPVIYQIDMSYLFLGNYKRH